jgi:curved DNA-binding protein
LNAVSAARLLGVAVGEGPEGLKRAFRAAVKAAHPDRPGGDAEQLRRVIEAYEWLKAAAPPPSAARPDPTPILEISPVEALCGGRHLTATADGRRIYVGLPPGLRAGDQVRVAGQIRVVAIAGEAGAAVIGDHLCLSVEVGPRLLSLGGTVLVETPVGPRSVRITRQDAIRGLVRVVGKGLPPRAGRPRGDLLLRLRPAAPGAAEASESEDKLRRFTADWAA